MGLGSSRSIVSFSSPSARQSQFFVTTWWSMTSTMLSYCPASLLPQTFDPHSPANTPPRTANNNSAKPLCLQSGQTYYLPCSTVNYSFWTHSLPGRIWDFPPWLNIFTTEEMSKFLAHCFYPLKTQGIRPDAKTASTCDLGIELAKPPKTQGSAV